VTLVVAGMLAATVVTAFEQFAYSADAMYLPALYRDLASGTPVRHWRVPPAPGFLPDMPLMLGILWATGQDIGLSFVLYGVAFAFLLAGATLYLIWGMIRPQWWHAFIVLACLFLWARALLAGSADSYFLVFVLLPTFHSGVILLAIFILGCTIRLLQRPWPKALAVVWVLAAGGGISSDPFFLVQVFVPVLFCMYLCRRTARFPQGLPLGIAVLLGASAGAVGAAGLAVARRVFYLGADTWEPVTIQITQLFRLFAETYKMFQPFIRDNPAARLAICLGFAMAAIVLACECWVFRKAAPREGSPAAERNDFRVLFCMLFFLVSGAASLLFAILSRLMGSPVMSRYALPVYVLPAVVMGVVLSLLTASRRRAVRFSVIAVVFIGLVVSPVVLGWSPLPPRLVPGAPAFVGDLDELHRRTGVTNGLGNYWLAKPTSLLSRCGVHVDQLNVWEPHHHVNNLYWYLQPGQAGGQMLRKYEFIIPSRIFPSCLPERIIARFGPPVAYDGPAGQALIYNRKSDVAFRNFLHMPVILGMGMKPPSTIKSPANLQEYKKEGLPYDHPGCSIIPVGGSLEVLFDPPAEGDVLEISADNNDEYEAEVRYVGGRSESLKLPTVWENGMQRRFLSLSSSEGIPKVQGLTIRPLRGDGVYSIGHVFVYRDSW
jgi:hypothetical protein